MADTNRFQAIISHCKEYGFIFPSSEIYDGLSAVYDYGQYGSELKKDIKDQFMLVMEDITALTNAVKINFKNLEFEMALLKRAIIAPFGQIEGAAFKIKVPKPKSFNDNKNTKELETFFCGIWNCILRLLGFLLMIKS